MAEQNHTKIYLKLPWVSQSDFKDLTSQLKKEGARFDWSMKKWYVSPGQEEKFQEYIARAPTELAKDKGILEDILRHTLSPIQLVVPNSVDVNYEMKLLDGRTIRMRENEILKLAQVESRIDMTLLNIVEALEKKVSEVTRFIETEKNYDISLGHDMSDNTCLVCFRDQEKLPYKLFGEQYNVYFPELASEKIQEIIEKHIEERETCRNEEQKQFKVGDMVILSIPKRTFIKDADAVITDIAQVKGIVQYIHHDEKEGYDTLSLTDEKGVTCFVDSNTIYNSMQHRILHAAKDKLSIEQFVIIAREGLSGEQMEAIYRGFKEGLTLQQVSNYARPELIAWQMDLYRYGQLNHVPYPYLKKNIQECIVKREGWKGCLIKIDEQIRKVKEIIGEIERNGFRPRHEIIKGMLHLNQITEKENTLDDICRALKENTYIGRTGELVQELGNMFRNQEMQRMERFNHNHHR